ncbi:MAG: hypothetical protein HKN46_05340 [Acidimicrobiia bacterium]|nr:hypothetical protein [Acidimicrobiia bacterium]
MDDAAEEDMVASAVPKLDLPLLGVLEPGPLTEVQLEDLRASLGGTPTPVFLVVPNCDGVAFEEALVLDVIGAGIASSDDLDVRVLLTEDDAVLVVDPETCDLLGTR